jgi:hypothetical protein
MVLVYHLGYCTFKRIRRAQTPVQRLDGLRRARLLYFCPVAVPYLDNGISSPGRRLIHRAGRAPAVRKGVAI